MFTKTSLFKSFLNYIECQKEKLTSSLTPIHSLKFDHRALKEKLIINFIDH